MKSFGICCLLSGFLAVFGYTGTALFGQGPAAEDPGRPYCDCDTSPHCGHGVCAVVDCTDPVQGDGLRGVCWDTNAN